MAVEASPRYKAYDRRNFKSLPQVAALDPELVSSIEVAAHVFPFKVNQYVVDELIDWRNVPDDPIFRLTFPQREMLSESDFTLLERLIREGDAEALASQIARIRLDMNPHPASQLEANVPKFRGAELPGVQHKYRETVLYFPSAGQTCHAYCTFCFRWPQFIGEPDLKFASKDAAALAEYIKANPGVTDVLFTGGDPLIMRTKIMRRYVEPLLEAEIEHLRTVRFGTKALSYWPHRFVTDDDADELLELFELIVSKGKNLAIMAHFNHWAELETPIVREAVRRLRGAGAVIRTQSPLVRHINDSADVWRRLWTTQVQLGMVPYYMFVERDTGARHYFEVPLERAWRIYREAVSGVSGLARTARGPSMSADPGKIEVQGVATIAGEKVFVLRMLQGRNPDWTHRPFFAKYDPEATWIDQLEPAFGEERFFFEVEAEEGGAAADVHYAAEREASRTSVS